MNGNLYNLSFGEGKKVDQVAERRRYVRFSSGESAYAALGPRYVKAGKIMEFSIGGLAFKYIANQEDDHHSYHVNIFLKDMRFHLSNIPCKIIYDIPIVPATIDNFFDKKITMNKCGVKFENLTENMMSKLNFFLETYAKGTPS